MRLPKGIISKCHIQLEEIDSEFLQVLADDMNMIKKVRYFMNKYATLSVMYWYGW